MGIILNIARIFLEGLLNFAQKIVSNFVIINPDNFAQGGVITAWAQMRNLCDILFILVLLTIALLNLFSETVDAYTIKKLLPRLLIAFILINASLLICRLVVDFSNVLAAAFLKIDDLKNLPAIQQSQAHLEEIRAAVGLNDLATSLMALVMALVGIFAVLGACFLLIFRIVMIWLLVMLAPLAFLAWVIPQTQQLFSKWWMQFLKYVFIGPVMCLILAFGKIVAAGVNQMADKSIALLFSSGTLLAAIGVPLALGGVAMAKVAQWGGRAGKRLWGYTGAKAVARAKEEYLSQMAEKRGPLGRMLGRFQTERGRAKREAALAQVREPIYARMSNDKLAKLANKKNDQMAIHELVRRGQSHRLSHQEGFSPQHLTPENRLFLAQQNPVLAGLAGGELQSWVDDPHFNPENLTPQGIESLLPMQRSDGEPLLSSSHLHAILERGNQAQKDALYNYYAQNPAAFDQLEGSVKRSLVHSALSSTHPKEAAGFLRGLGGNRLRAVLQEMPPAVVKEWQQSGTFDQIKKERVEREGGAKEAEDEIKAWAEGNAAAIRELYERGEISQAFYESLGSPGRQQQQQQQGQNQQQQQGQNQGEAPPPP